MTAIYNFSSFSPQEYLKEYYSHIGKENAKILKFLHRSYQTIFSSLPKARVLEFGGGPTIYQLISLAKYPVTIDFYEYLKANRDEVKKWLHNFPDQYSWQYFFRFVLKLEHSTVSPKSVSERQYLLRCKVHRIGSGNAHLKYPAGKSARPYDIVSTNFVAESITHHRSTWKKILRHISSLVKPSRYLIMNSIIGAKKYAVGKMTFPATPISHKELIDELNQMGYKILSTNYVPAENPTHQGYLGIHLLLAQKNLQIGSK